MKEYSRMYVYMIKILNMYQLFALTISSRQAPATLINTLKTSLYLVCFLLFSHGVLPKFRENYGDSPSVI